VAGTSGFADYIIIMSGSSDRQVISTAKYIDESLSKRAIHPLGIEGLSDGRWVLMDFGDIVIHVFLEEIRAFFDLEGIWSDAPRTRYDETGAVVTDED
jgi:ribosome-associated protein